MGQIADIVEFFVHAARHPVIGHVPPVRNRFYGFNFEEFESQKSNTDFFPCLGLSDSPHSGLAGTFSGGPDETSVVNTMGINVLVLDIYTSGKYDLESDLYDRLLPFMQDLANYIQAKVAKGPLSDYPFLDRIDLSNMPIVRVGPKGAAKAYGWKLSLNFRNRSINDSITNPLNILLG